VKSERMVFLMEKFELDNVATDVAEQKTSEKETSKQQTSGQGGAIGSIGAGDVTAKVELFNGIGGTDIGSNLSAGDNSTVNIDNSTKTVNTCSPNRFDGVLAGTPQQPAIESSEYGR